MKTDAELVAELCQISTKIQRNSFHIIHICTEMEPLVSSGSLASYVTGLSRAMQQKGNLVEVILPKYATLDLSEVEGLRETKSEFYSYFDGQTHGNRIWTGVIYGIGVTFIQPERFSSFFNRERIYGYTDDFERFMYFSRASLDYIVLSVKHPDILHIHNWETAIVAPLFWDIFVKQGLEGTRILLTCQEFESQRLELPDKLSLCGLDPSSLNCPDRLQDNARTNLLNILKGGIVYSNKIVMMSSMSSKERIIRNLAHGLETTLGIHKDKVLSAPYGFEQSLWDPSTDRVLPENYDPDSMKGKSVCKAALQQRVGLFGHSSTILVGCIFPEASARDLESLLEIVQVASKRGETQLKAMRYGAAPINLSCRSRHLEDDDTGNTRFSRFINSYFGNLTLLQALDEIDHNPISIRDPQGRLNAFKRDLQALQYGSINTNHDLNSQEIIAKPDNISFELHEGFKTIAKAVGRVLVVSKRGSIMDSDPDGEAAELVFRQGLCLIDLLEDQESTFGRARSPFQHFMHHF